MSGECPSCGSTKVRRMYVVAEVADTCACKECGLRWDDPGSDPVAKQSQER